MKYPKGLIKLASVLTVFLFVLTPTNLTVAAGRDCDSNALIYCGVLTKDELRDALKNGTGKKYQTAKQLQNLFGYYKIYSGDVDKLVNGYVTSDNRVVVDGKTLSNGKNVYTMGRSYMPGSTRLKQFSYPIYKRHPSVSFRSNSLSAFVKMNPDNTFAYAIIKSCGNIVPGKVYVPPTVPKYNIYALKWIDTNRNGLKDEGEVIQPGVRFSLGGNGLSLTAVSDGMGYAWFNNLPAGTYTLTETVPEGYDPTTGTTQTVTTEGGDGASVGRLFGNAKHPQPEYGQLQIIKYNDINGNKIQDDSEPVISGWKFDVTGPNSQNFQLVTDTNGMVTREGLAPGDYTVTEVLEEGWTPTTGLSATQTVRANETATYIFGNQLYKQPPTKKREKTGTTLPVTGPLAVATMAGGSAIFSGAAVAWARSKRRFRSSFRK